MYDMVAQNPESTVVAEYKPSDNKATTFQSESDLENSFILQLEKQAYEYLNIKTESDLIINLRNKLELLNNYKFSDNEWNHFFKSKVANQNSGIKEKTAIIQTDHIQLLARDNEPDKNIMLLDKNNIHNNSLQVINQYSVEDGQYSNRYDVTILVNGLPLVHIELKKRGVDIKEAFNQIKRYDRESFWAGSGLYEYIQIFVISNGTLTKYYSNTIRESHIKENCETIQHKGKRSSNSYEFTSWWADANNKAITDLMGFCKTFFAKHTILNILTKYCVFTVDKLLLVMRPYQIVATERIISKIIVANNYKKYGSIDGGGYIWHTTGSGKTLTSFKTALLASKLNFIDKVLFVVDRKDLDYQTMKEYDKFEKGAANSNTSTSILKKQIENSEAKIIITTIQKLSILIKKEKDLPVYNKHIVIIFDECHRSQFGDMHKTIIKSFKKYHLFGFTGTPIFAVNSSKYQDLSTTEQVFGDKLHTYTIVDAITDKNVLPFKIDYFSTMKKEEDIADAKVWDIDRESALSAPERITNIVKYIREHFDQKTKRNTKPYHFTALNNISAVANAKDRLKIEEIKNKIQLSGFNSIFAVASIDMAKQYYNEFKKQQINEPVIKQLKIATIFSYGANDIEDDGLFDENPENTDCLNKSHREFLDIAIKDYNAIFKTNYDTSSDKFQNYYKDVSLRMKNRELDLLIVVNMFLTGFDATTLNTLWVDKNLRLHGLLQAYSRTNRILNSIKTFGNIVCFRNLEKATNESIALFGDKEAGGLVLLKSFEEYYNGYNDDNGKVAGYKELIEQLQSKFPVGERIVGEDDQKEFIKLYSAILKVKNILSTFDEFMDKEILSERDVQDYHSLYIDLYNQFRGKQKVESENINDDILFEIELIKQVEINIDYILALIKRYHDDHNQDKELVVKITKAIDSSITLRNKKDLIEVFLNSLTPDTDVENDWLVFVNTKRKEELDQIILDEGLSKDETYKFITNAFRDGFVQTTGTALTKILPPVSRFSPSGDRAKKKEIVLEKLETYFNKYYDISGKFNFDGKNYSD